jgi:hypothetical protein
VSPRRAALIPALLLLAACAPSQSPAQATAFPAGGAPAAGAGCVDTASARDIWTRVDHRLNAIVLDPKHQGLSDVATGAALTQLQQYVQQMLVVNGVTEREVDSLDALTVSDAGCAGGSLKLTIATRATTDDYLRPDGSVDHADPMVGVEVHLLETFARVSGVWKESDVQSLESPSPSGQIV